MSARPLIIGISGGTGSGKTTIAEAILERIGAERIEWISHDAYYRDFRGLEPNSHHPINFDHPDALETELLARHLDILASGEAADIPIYDFATHTRKGDTRRVEPRRVVLVEGILVLADPELRKRLDIKLFVDTPSDIRLVRRLVRDIEERGRTLHSVVQQYLQTVRPMHEEFVEPSKRYADLIIPVGSENAVALEAIVARIERLVHGQ